MDETTGCAARPHESWPDSGCHDLDPRLVEIIEDIARRHPSDYLGEDLRSAAALVFALDACDDQGLLERLVEVVDQDEAPWQLRAEILGQLWGRVTTASLMPIVDRMSLVGTSSHLAEQVAHELATATLRGAVELDVLADWLKSSGLATVDKAGSPAAACDYEWQQVVEAVTLRTAVTATDDTAPDTVAVRALMAWAKRGHHELFGFYAIGFTTCQPRPATGSPPESSSTPPTRTPPTIWPAPVLYRRATTSSGGFAGTRRRHRRAPRRLPPTSQSGSCRRRPRRATRARALVSELPQLQQLVDELFSPDRVQAAADAAEQAAARATGQAAAAAAEQFSSTRLTTALAASDWPQVARELRAQVGTDKWVVGSPIDTAPAWRALDAPTRASTIDAAETYLVGLPTTVQADSADHAGLAYDLVGRQDPTRLARLDPGVMVAWLDVIRTRPAQDASVAALVARLTTARPDQLGGS